MIIKNNNYNIGYICTKLQCEYGYADKIALRYISSQLINQDFSFGDLDILSDKFANVLKELRFFPEDVLFSFLPKIPEQFFAILGALKAKVIVSPLFSNVGEETIIDRMNDSKGKGIITKKSYLKKILTLKNKIPSLKNIIVVDIDNDEGDFILSYNRLMESADDNYAIEITQPFQPSLLHYTSGSTGKPKGVCHIHGGIEYQNKTIKEVMQLEADDLFWCTADQGWVTGTTYGITAPWSEGITQLHYGGGYNPEIWFDLLRDEKISVWYTAPTALRMIMREEEDFFKKYSLPYLKHIFSVGEPLNPEIISWSRKTLNKDIYDTWFQTETGAILIANHPGIDIKPGSMGKPVDNINAEIIDESGAIADCYEHGNLCIKSGWKSMFINYLNNNDSYKSKFKNGYYYSGDKAYKDDDGYFWFIGRSDDIINTAGHLVSPFEVESALLEIDEIAEGAVIGVPDEILYEKVVAYVVLKKSISSSDELELKIRIFISNKVSSTATPQEIIFIENIPKNKSGKIMRRVLKARYLGQDEGDISTMEV